MIELLIDDTALVVRVEDGDFRPRNDSQLAYWGFSHDPDSGSFSVANSSSSDLAAKLVAYFERAGLPFRIDANLQAVLKNDEEARLTLQRALQNCRQLKNGVAESDDLANFRNFVDNTLSRPLKDHQFKAALHLLSAKNGANFSVPGSGKTSVVLAVFERLRQQGDVDSLFVVGPNKEARVNRWYNLPDRLERVVERLRHIRIEKRDARKLLHMFSDRPATLVYLDPPYFTKREHGYVIDANDEEFHEELLEICLKSRSMILLSGYDNELYQKTLVKKGKWTKRKIETHTRDTTGKDYARTEMLWMNRRFNQARKTGRVPIRLTRMEKAENKINPPRKR